MKKYLIIALFSLFTLNTFAQTIEERNVGKFDKVKVCCGISTYITEGNSSKLTVETNKEEWLDEVITEVKNGVLNISVKQNTGKTLRNFRVIVSITASNLKEINTTSGAHVYGTEQLNADDIEINSTSGSGITLDLKANNIVCKATSGSDITLKGSAKYAEVSATSAGDIKMKDMTVASAEAKATSGADISLTVTDELNASATSGADIAYYGEPKIVNKKASSGGGIKRK